MNDLNRKNKKSLIIVASIIFIMIGFSFASVPLYRIFCQVTGYGGITKRVAKNDNKIYDREITVSFNADTSPNLPWIFKPEVHKVKVKVGEESLIYYYAENKSNKTITGRAIHNVTPLKAGEYFNKVQCFCFNDQVLKPGEKARLPISFFIDPLILEDNSMDDVYNITLSYTFFQKDSIAMEKAVKKLYNDTNNE